MPSVEELLALLVKQMDDLNSKIDAAHCEMTSQMKEFSKEVHEAIVGRGELEVNAEIPKEEENVKEERKHEPSFPMPPLEACEKEENEDESTFPKVLSTGVEQGPHAENEKEFVEEEVLILKESNPKEEEPEDEDQQGGCVDRVEKGSHGDEKKEVEEKEVMATIDEELKLVPKEENIVEPIDVDRQ